jgi:hypothetical protein
MAADQKAEKDDRLTQRLSESPAKINGVLPNVSATFFTMVSMGKDIGIQIVGSNDLEVMFE